MRKPAAEANKPFSNVFARFVRWIQVEHLLMKAMALSLLRGVRLHYTIEMQISLCPS